MDNFPGNWANLTDFHLQNNRSMDSMDMSFDHQTTIAFTICCSQDLLGIGCPKAQTLSKAPSPILLSKSSSVMLNALAKSICFPSFHRIERSCLQQTTPSPRVPSGHSYSWHKPGVEKGGHGVDMSRSFLNLQLQPWAESCSRFCLFPQVLAP